MLSLIGIGLEEIEGQAFIINPTVIRVMRVLRIARVLKLLKMAKGIRSLLNTVMQALPQVGNLGKKVKKSPVCSNIQILRSALLSSVLYILCPGC